MNSEISRTFALLTTQVLGVFGLYQVAQPSSAASDTLTTFLDVLKIVIPALLAYLASRMQAKREQRIAQGTIEEKTRDQLAKQQEGVFEEYRTISLQAREVVAKSYEEAAEAKAARRLAEERAQTLESELEELKRKYDGAIEELDELRRRMRQKSRGGSGRE